MKETYSKEGIENCFNRAFDSFPEIERSSVIMDFGVPFFTKHAQVFDTHSKRYIISSLLYDVMLGIVRSALIILLAIVLNLPFLLYLLPIPVLLLSMLEIDHLRWEYRSRRKHNGRFVIRFHEKLKNDIDLDFLMFHEFGHVLCCMGIVKDRWLFFREEGICDKIAEERLELHSSSEVLHAY